MTRKQAAEIARRYYTFNTGEMPNEVHISIYNMEDGIAKCTIPAIYRGDKVFYKVEFNTIANTIVMQHIENESPLADFLRTETRLSTLNRATSSAWKATAWCTHTLEKANASAIQSTAL